MLRGAEDVMKQVKDVNLACPFRWLSHLNVRIQTPSDRTGPDLGQN